MKKINTLSLFSGAGGLDIGFHHAGFNILACVEIEEKYCKTLEKNQQAGIHISKRTKIHHVDIREFDVSVYENEGIECVIGGPPCQTFSAAGRRAGGVIGTDDERGQLYEAYCKILDIIQPKVFIFENVYGLPGANGGTPWLEIQNAFSDHGYKLHAEVVDAADYGVPQHRERIIMIGTKDGKFDFPLPTFGPDSNSRRQLVSVYDAIKDIQNLKEKFSEGLGGMYGHLLPEVPEGLNYAFFTSEMGHPEPVFAWRSKFHDLLYKVNRNEPSRTIKANPGKFTGPFHWKNRHFTVQELKRLQTFPDDYELVGSYTQIVEQIGNSVPPLLAKVIAESVKEQILIPTKKLKYKVRPQNFKSTFRQRQRERSNNFKLIAQNAIKRKYGEIKYYTDPKTIKPKVTHYFSVYSDRFERLVNSKLPNEENYLACVLTETGKHLRIDVDAIGNDQLQIELTITITGLNKYLPKFDTLRLEATASTEENIFQSWKEIECVLVARSNFFTLIDIYGHYANRGDVINVATEISGKKSKFLTIVQYFTQTANCGGFFKADFLMKKFKISESKLYATINEMRNLRFDIRTSLTHPIIGKGNILCTYPFPLLSPRAFVQSKAKVYKPLINERQIH